MASSKYRYLNDLFYSKLEQAIQKGPKKMPPAQWADWIRAQANKGVKLTEADEIGLFDVLAQMQSDESITRNELLDLISLHRPYIKEIEVIPQYRRYSHAGDNDEYKEILYQLVSAANKFNDDLIEIEFELQEMDFGFDIDPERVAELTAKYEELKEKTAKAKEFKRFHHSGIKDPETGKELTNVLGHIRYTQNQQGLFLIEEIQSDWAQKGRRANWNQDRGFPKAAFVTDTELWSSLLLRRALQIAARKPTVKNVAIISGHGTHNGGVFPSRDCDSSGKPIGVTSFYRQLSKRIQKWLKPSKTKIDLIKVNSLGGKAPLFNMSDEARKDLSAPKPYYCEDSVNQAREEMTEEELDIRKQQLESAILSAREMLGDVVSIKLVSQVVHAADNKNIAGKMQGNLIEVSLNAKNPIDVLNHEAWHYAHENLLGPMDRQAIETAFEYGTELNKAVRSAIIRNGYSNDALLQCDDPKEAAAYGFAFWAKGEIGVTLAERSAMERSYQKGFSRSVGELFAKVERAYMSLHRWVRRVVGYESQLIEQERVKDLFERFKSSALSQLRQDQPYSRSFEYDNQPKKAQIPARHEIEAYMVRSGWVQTPEKNWLSPQKGKIIYVEDVSPEHLLYALAKHENADLKTLSSMIVSPVLFDESDQYDSDPFSERQISNVRLR